MASTTHNFKNLKLKLTVESLFLSVMILGIDLMILLLLYSLFMVFFFMKKGCNIKRSLNSFALKNYTPLVV